MELQIPYRICTEISPQSVLQGKKSSNRKNLAGTVWMERRKDHRSRSMPGSYPSLRRDPPEIFYFGVHGISKGKKRCKDVWAIRRTQIQISQSGVLVQGILRRHRGKEREPNCGVRIEGIRLGVLLAQEVTPWKISLTVWMHISKAIRLIWAAVIARPCWISSTRLMQIY